MAKQREWRILQSFDWCPRPNVVMAFKDGEIHSGLTRACREHAGDRIEEISDDTTEMKPDEA